MDEESEDEVAGLTGDNDGDCEEPEVHEESESEPELLEDRTMVLDDEAHEHSDDDDDDPEGVESTGYPWVLNSTLQHPRTKRGRGEKWRREGV